MVVATGTAMLIGGAASAAASAYGSHKAEKAAAKAKAKNMESLAAAIGDLGQGKQAMLEGYNNMAGFTADYAEWASQHPDDIRANIESARNRMMQGGLESQETLALAAQEREMYGREQLGRISQAESLIMKDQQRARDQAVAQRESTGMMGSATTAMEMQMGEQQGLQLQQASLAAGSQAAGITGQMAAQLMGLRTQAGSQQFAEAQTLGQMGMTEAAMGAGAEQEGAAARRGIGELGMGKAAGLQDYYSQLAALRMGVQHKGPQGPNAWQQAGAALGGLDWASMPGVGGQQDSGYWGSQDEMMQGMTYAGPSSLGNLPDDAIGVVGHGEGGYQEVWAD